MISTDTSMMDRMRPTLQYWRAPIMTVLVAAGVYLIRQSSVWLWTGMAVTLFGEMIQLWSASHLTKDRALITSGPYSHVRNPMYFGRFFVGLGFVIMVQIPLIVAAYTVLFALYVNGRVGREEARLRNLFGEDYARYCAEVRRFLPRLRPYSRAAAERCRWSRIVANHEYLNLIAALAVFAVILVRLRFL